MGEPATQLPSQPNTIRKGGGRSWIYPVDVRGRRARLRAGIAMALIVIFYATPWIRVGGEPLLRLSLLSSSYSLFGRKLFMHEFHHFALLALLLVLTLFLVSAMFGRVWCGLACPQTIWIEHVLRRIERLCEGNAIRRKVRDGGPASVERAIRKTMTQTLFILVCLSFSGTLVAIFAGPQAVLAFTDAPVCVSVTCLALLAWFDGAVWREQFCHLVCPYARLQAVFQDSRTMAVGFDAARGEPRGRRKSASPLGDCIDCGLCVRTCPSGIDIRQGPQQLECTSCTRCMDACDSVMQGVGRKTGLVRFDLASNFTHATAFPEREARASWKTAILRPRVLGYAIAWLGIFSVGLVHFLNRSPIRVLILGVGSTPYVESEGLVRNILTLRISNQSLRPSAYKLTLLNPTSQIRLESPASTPPVASGSELLFPLLLTASKERAPDAFVIEVMDEAGHRIQAQRAFLAPKRSAP